MYRRHWMFIKNWQVIDVVNFSVEVPQICLLALESWHLTALVCMGNNITVCRVLSTSPRVSFKACMVCLLGSCIAVDASDIVCMWHVGFPWCTPKELVVAECSM